MESSDELSFTELLEKAQRFAALTWHARWMLGRVIALFAACGVVYALGSAEEYSASMRILPYRGSASSGLSGLAGLAGVRLPGGSVEQTITADLYPELLASIDFRISVAEAPLVFGTVPEKASSVEYFRTLRRPSFVERLTKYTVGLPGLVRERARPPRTPAPPATAQNETGLRVLDPGYVALVESIGDRVSIGVDRRTSVMVISGRMPDPYAAADLVRVTADKLMDRIMAFESRKAAEQFEFVQEKYVAAERRYDAAQRELAVFADQNRIIMTPSVRSIGNVCSASTTLPLSWCSSSVANWSRHD